MNCTFAVSECRVSHREEIPKTINVRRVSKVTTNFTGNFEIDLQLRKSCRNTNANLGKREITVRTRARTASVFLLLCSRDWICYSPIHDEAAGSKAAGSKTAGSKAAGGKPGI